jgi:hypothetical protein
MAYYSQTCYFSVKISSVKTFKKFLSWLTSYCSILLWDNSTVFYLSFSQLHNYVPWILKRYYWIIWNWISNETESKDSHKESLIVPALRNWAQSASQGKQYYIHTSFKSHDSCNEVFSGNHPCMYGVTIQHFRECLQISMLTWLIAWEDFNTFCCHENKLMWVTWTAVSGSRMINRTVGSRTSTATMSHCSRYYKDVSWAQYLNSAMKATYSCQTILHQMFTKLKQI